MHVIINFQGKGEMLTYFLEGEDASQRTRRISHTRFSRKNSPHSPEYDPSQAIFGKSTIHPKYWPNGNVICERPDSLESFPNCDNQIQSSYGSPNVCDNNFDTNRAYCVTENLCLNLPTPPTYVQSSVSPVSQPDHHQWTPTTEKHDSSNNIHIPKSHSDNYVHKSHTEPFGRFSSLDSNHSTNQYFNGINNTAESQPTVHISKPERLPLLNETKL